MSGCSNVYRNTRGLVLSLAHEEFSLTRMELLLIDAAVNKRIWPKVVCDVALKGRRLMLFSELVVSSGLKPGTVSLDDHSWIPRIHFLSQ